MGKDGAQISKIARPYKSKLGPKSKNEIAWIPDGNQPESTRPSRRGRASVRGKQCARMYPKTSQEGPEIGPQPKSPSFENGKKLWHRHGGEGGGGRACVLEAIVIATDNDGL